MRRLVVDLRSRGEAFRLPEATSAKIRAAAAPDWEVWIVEAETESSGDGARTPSAEAIEAVPEAEAYLGFGMPKALFTAARKLKWVHTAAAGVGSMLYPEMVESDVVLTNSAGEIYGPPIAEHVVAGILHFLRGFDIAFEQKRAARWDSAPFGTDEAMLREVPECRAVIVGAGGIGGGVARRLGALGAHVVTVRHDPSKGKPEGAAEVVGPDGLDAALPDADILVLAAPLTDETRALLTAERIAKLPGGAIVCNVARGTMVDEPALIDALRTRRIRGALLDVFAVEPLAAESPLWHLPNVVLTPHMSGVSPRLYWVRLERLFLDNWARWRAGRPLRNTVNKRAGY